MTDHGTHMARVAQEPGVRRERLVFDPFWTSTAIVPLVRSGASESLTRCDPSSTVKQDRLTR